MALFFADDAAEVAHELVDDAQGLAVGSGGGAGGVDFLAILRCFVGEGGDFVGGGVEVDDDDFPRLKLIGVEGGAGDSGGDVVPAVVVKGALGAGRAEELEDILTRGLADLDLREARGEDDLTTGVDGFAACGDNRCRQDKTEQRESKMFFHWLKHYGKGRGGATEVVDDIFARAVAASPAVFEGDSTKEPERQAKFEHVCPWVALALVNKDEAEAKRILEEMVDRLEIGLREGGVGDMKVGVHVRKYVAALHGRVRRYATLMDGGDWEGLAVALGEHGVDGAVVKELKKGLKG